MVLCFLCATVVVFIFLLVLILHCYNLICYKNLGCLKIKPGVICPYCHKCSLSRCVNDCALFVLWKFKNTGILKYMYYCHSLVLLLWIAFVFTHVRKCGWESILCEINILSIYLFWAFRDWAFLRNFSPLYISSMCVWERERAHTCTYLSNTGHRVFFFLISVHHLLN